MQENLFELRHVSKHFKVGKKTLKAVDDVNFTIRKGETLGVVGESGCGKTTCGRTLIKLYEATTGEIVYRGKDIKTMNPAEMKNFRKNCQIIFQDPYASLNPRMTVESIIQEGLVIHGLLTPKERKERVYQLLELVGLNKEHASRFPHEFSGGQRQRIGIARALAIDPEFIVCDEPISALDVSIQAQVVNLLIKLQRELGLTYMFIAHDLSMVKHISDRIMVMYLGSVVELTDSDTIFKNPKHPYTKALISAIPLADPEAEKNRKQIELEGDVPSPINVPKGCKFAPRCRYATEICKTTVPEIKEVETNHQVACHNIDKIED